MTKTILITGATDGIGLLTGQMFAADGHNVLLHGRSAEKLDAAVKAVGGSNQTYRADLSSLEETAELAHAVKRDHPVIDILINNAGVLKAPSPVLPNGQDIRFVVNLLAPYVLTTALLPNIPRDGRILNLSSAAQAPVDLAALRGKKYLADMEAYSQSKLGITMWSAELARELADGPVVIAVNPGSLLASKMVKEGFGIAGNDLEIGASILKDLALNTDHAGATGRYWDNDAGRYAPPHGFAADPSNTKALMAAIKALV